MTSIRQPLLGVVTVFLKPNESGGGREMAVIPMLCGRLAL